MSGRGRRVLVYTVSLLAAPLPVMPWAKGTAEFAASLAPCGLVLALGSLYVLRGELRLSARGLPGSRLVAASCVTLLFGASLLVGSAVHLLRAR